MTTIVNKTRGPLSVSLPRGKTLRLGPGKTGQISSTAGEHPGVKKLLEAGDIEILGQGPRPQDHAGAGKGRRPWSSAHTSRGALRSSGDR